MDIRFLGPLGMVTGSCTWMRDNKHDWNFLVDCGMQQGERSADAWNHRQWPFEPSTIQFVVLTHAHIDHCGLLPRLYKDGFRGKVYCTRETKELAVILLEDAARHAGAPYERDDVKRIQWHEPGKAPLLGGTFHPVAQDLYLKFFRSGHILGAVSVAIYWGPKDKGQRSIVFSGDLGPSAEDGEHLPFLRHRMHPVACDYAVVESTYGGTIRPSIETDAEARHAQLRALLDRTLDNQGVLVLPSFALGRTQDVLFDLHWIVAENPARYGAIKYYFDAPTASRMHQIMLGGLERTESNGKKGKVRPLWLGKQMFRWFGLDDTNPVHVERLLDIIAMTLGISRPLSGAPAAIGNPIAQAWQSIMTPVSKRDAMLRQGLPRPSVVITGSGSCDGGPASDWLPNLLESSRTTLALTGYCSPATIGGQLMALKDTPVQERERHTGRLCWVGGASVRIAGVRAAIEQLKGYSAHADQAGLLDWLFWNFNDKWNASGTTIFIQHGEDEQRRQLAEAAQHRAGQLGLRIHAIAPKVEASWYDLDAGGEAIVQAAKKAKLLAELQRIQHELDMAIE